MADVKKSVDDAVIFDEKNGVLRMPKSDTSASSNSDTSSVGRGSKDNTSGDSKGTPANAAGIDPVHIEALKAAAAQGDKDSIDLLKALGIGLGVAGGIGGAYLLSKLRGRGKNPSAPVDAKVEPTSKTGTAVSAAEVPVTQLKNEQVIPRNSGYLENPVKKLPGPATKEITQSQKALKAAQALRLLAR